MEIKPIRKEAHYEEALREIERLWGAKEGTGEGDRLESWRRWLRLTSGSISRWMRPIRSRPFGFALSNKGWITERSWV